MLVLFGPSLIFSASPPKNLRTASTLALLGGLLCPGLHGQTAYFSVAQRTIPSSTLNRPEGVAADASGNVYIADTQNSRVLKETLSQGTYTESTVGSGLSKPSGVAVDSSGNVYIADQGNQRVLEETPSGGTYSQRAIGSGFTYPCGIAVDGSGDVYISDTGNSLNYKETPSAGSFAQSQLSGISIGSCGIAVDTAGNVYLADTSNARALKETLSGGSYFQSVIVTGLFYPSGITVDGAGDVYVSNTDGDSVVKATPSGTSYTQSTLNNAIAFPYGLTSDANGDIYIVEYLDNRILEDSPSGVNFGPVNIASSVSIPFTFTITSAGSIGLTQVLTQGVPNLDFTDAGTGSCTTNGTGYIYSAGNTCTVNVTFTPRAAGPRYGAVVLEGASGTPIATAYVQGTGSGPQVNFLPAVQSVLSLNGATAPYAMAVDAAGNLYIANAVSASDPGNTVIKETWNGSGYTASTIASGLGYPVAVAVDGAGNLFIADQDATKILQETPSNGGYTQSVAFSGLGNVEGVAVDGGGNIYIASLAYGLLKESLAAGSYSQSTIQSGASAHGLAVDGNGNVYAADGIVFQHQANGSYVRGTFPGGGVGVAVDGSGNVYTSQSYPGAVYKATLAGGAYTLSTLATASSDLNGVAVDGSGNVFFCGDSAGTVSKLDYADPPSLVFAPTMVGSTSSDSPKTVTVVNSGNAALNFTIPAAGMNPSVTTNFSVNSNGGSACPLLSTSSLSPVTLAAGASCNLPVSYTPTATGPLSGFVTLGDTALNAAAPNYTVQQIALGVAGAQSTPSIGWETPDSIAYGTPLSGIQLDASSAVAGTFTYTPAAGTVLGVGTSALAVTLAPTNTAQYTTASATTNITVNPATPAITWPMPATITYGTALGASQLNANSPVSGTLTYTPAAGSVLTAGQHTLSVTLTPTDTTDYTSAALTTTITIAPATPVIAWPNPQAITYGTALSTAQLDASAPTPGSYVYTPAVGTVPLAGHQALSVRFSPADTTDYLPATGSNSVLVNQAPLAITAANASRAYGASNPIFSVLVSGAVNNDTFITSASSVANRTSAIGSYAIVPSVSGTNLSSYLVTPANGTLTVTPATLTVVPSNVTRVYGAANPMLGGIVTGAVNGDTFSVTASTTATSTSPIGSYPITYTVAGSNLGDYTVIPANGILSVTAATPSITWPTPSAITYGTAISAAQLNATASAPGTFSYAPSAGLVPAAGTQTLSVTFTPTDSTDYATPPATTVSLAVNKAPLAITANSVARVFGAANPVFSGTVSGAVNGDTFAESFSTGATTASIVGSYPIVPTVAGPNLADYAVTSTNGALTISQAGTATTFALSNSNLTLTATVASLTSGMPTGSVGFYEGQTLVGTGTLANGIASYTATTFPAGDVVVSAQYSGDADFTQSASPPILVLSLTPAQTSLTVASTGTASDYINLAVATGFVGTLQLSCSGLPRNATCGFQPASVNFTGASSSASTMLSIQTGASARAMPPSLFPSDPRPATLAVVFWLPALILAGFARRGWQLRPRAHMLLFVTLIVGFCALVTGCGSSAPVTPAGTSTIQVVATGPSGFAQTTSVTLTVQ